MKLNKFKILRNHLLLASWFLLLGSFSTYAQDWQWIKDGGSSDNNEPEHVIDMVTDSDRNVYVISQVGKNGLTIDGNPKTNWGDNTTLADVVLASFSCDGTYRWSKIIGGASADIVKSVQVDSQDNVYIVGRFAGYQSTQYPPRIDNDYIMSQSPADARLLFLAKFNKDGIFQWIKRPQAPGVALSSQAFSLELEIDNDELYWFVRLDSGTYANGAFTNTLADKNLFVFKYDVNGNFINATHLDWLSSNGGNGGNIKMYRNPYNGYFYMMFRKNGSTSVVSVNGTNISNATFIACYDNTGIFQWLRESNTNGIYDVTLHGLAFDPSNNIYVAGKMTGYGTGISFLGFTVPENLIPAFILKVNPTADTLLWGSYGTSSAENIGGLIYNGSEVAYAGSGNHPDFTWGNMSLNINPDGTHRDVLFARFDSQTGSTLSLSKITGDSGNLDYGTAIAVDTNGDYLVGGGFGHYIYDSNGNQNINAGGSSDFFVAKYATGSCNALSVANIVLDKVQVYPNPVKNKLYITSKDAITSIEVYTVLGQKIITNKVNQQATTTLDVTKLVKGTYFVKVQVGHTVSNYTFIKE